MRDWVSLNLFLLGITVTAAALFAVMAIIIRGLGLEPGLEHSLVGCAAVASLFGTYFIWRAIWRSLQRRI